MPGTFREVLGINRSGGEIRRVQMRWYAVPLVCKGGSSNSLYPIADVNIELPGFVADISENNLAIRIIGNGLWFQVELFDDQLCDLNSQYSSTQFQARRCSGMCYS